MVFESYPWKQDLLRRKRLLIKYNTPEQFQKDDVATYTVIEKAIFYSAFIIRKLIDCGGKVSDEADSYTMCAKAVKPLKHINAINRWPEEGSHDWDHEQRVVVKGKDVCNWLIHSYLFFVSQNEDGRVETFYVSSDYDRNKVLYSISIQDWLNYIEFIATDDIVSLSSHFDEKKKDYVYTRKERGIRKVTGVT